MPAGAAELEEAAGEAAERALQLKQLTDKGARMRKKKALNDLLRALADFGFTKRRSAVPVHDRSVQAWFSQVCKHVPLVVAQAQLAPHGFLVALAVPRHCGPFVNAELEWVVLLKTVDFQLAERFEWYHSLTRPSCLLQQRACVHVALGGIHRPLLVSLYGITGLWLCSMTAISAITLCLLSFTTFGGPVQDLQSAAGVILPLSLLLISNSDNLYMRA